MNECPTCRKSYGQAVKFCPEHGIALVSTSGRTSAVTVAGGKSAVVDEFADAIATSQSALFAPGTNIGGYEITRKIGEGGMGEVYAGVHPVIGREVAIKVLVRSLSRDPTMAKRFVSEGRAVTAIGHENIVDMISFGELPSGELFLIMELLNGESLGDRLEREPPLPTSEMTAIVLEVCDALQAAHAAGVVHRDLKPDNIFLSKRKTGKQVTKLLDFGIAKLVNSQQFKKTQTGMTVGTPHYMAPEQCLGKEVEPSADVYSLGIIMFELTTGRLPFAGESFIEVMNGHISGSAPEPHVVKKNVPLRLSKLIVACMRKKPAERPNIAQVVAELRALEVELTGSPQPASQPAIPQPSPPARQAPQPNLAPKQTVPAKVAPNAEKRPQTPAAQPSFLDLRKQKASKPAAKKGGPDPVIYDVIDELERSAKNLGAPAGWTKVDPEPTRRPSKKTKAIANKGHAGMYLSIFALLVVSAGSFWFSRSMTRPLEDPAPFEPPQYTVHTAAAADEKGWVHVKVSTNVAKATFVIDGRTFLDGAQVLEVAIRPGMHHLVVNAKGFHSFTKAIQVKLDQPLELDAKLEPRSRKNK